MNEEDRDPRNEPATDSGRLAELSRKLDDVLAATRATREDVAKLHARFLASEARARAFEAEARERLQALGSPASGSAGKHDDEDDDTTNTGLSLTG